MTIASEITRIKTNIENAYTKAEEKGATMPELLNSEGLAGCIESIPKGEGGGSGIPEGKHRVRFFDYDGKILSEQILNHGDAIVVPEAPTHNNLIFSRWNQPCETVTGTQDVGAIYDTIDGYTYINIELTEETGLEFNIALGVMGAKIDETYTTDVLNEYTVDFGDSHVLSGEIIGTYAEEGVNTNIQIFEQSPFYEFKNLSHTYSNYGKYTIKISGFFNNSYKRGTENHTNYYDRLPIILLGKYSGNLLLHALWDTADSWANDKTIVKNPLSNFEYIESDKAVKSIYFGSRVGYPYYSYMLIGECLNLENVSLGFDADFYGGPNVTKVPYVLNVFNAKSKIKHLNIPKYNIQTLYVRTLETITLGAGSNFQFNGLSDSIKDLSMYMDNSSASVEITRVMGSECNVYICGEYPLNKIVCTNSPSIVYVDSLSEAEDVDISVPCIDDIDLNNVKKIRLYYSTSAQYNKKTLVNNINNATIEPKLRNVNFKNDYLKVNGTSYSTTSQAVMMDSCAGLRVLDLSDFNMANNFLNVRFNNNANLEEEIFPKNLTQINPSNLFNECIDIKKINIPNVTLSGTSTSYMFGNCYNLENIYIDENVDFSNITNLNYMFQNCYSLKQIPYMKNLQKISPYMFGGMKIKKLNVQDGVTKIDS